jgi:hypothetical protein
MARPERILHDTPKKSRLFRAAIPLELVLKFLEVIGILGLNDCRWFSKHVFTPAVCEKVDDLIIQLEPYYWNHKQFLVHRDLTPLRYIQVYKHILKSVGYRFDKRDAKGVEVSKKKTLLYRLASESPQPQKEANFTVEFN